MTDFAGLTKDACPAACTANGCILISAPWCGHPCKGGIPARFKDDPAIQKTFAEACELLAVPNPHTNPNRLTP